VSNPACRYDSTRRVDLDDGWQAPEVDTPRTSVTVDFSHSIIARNRSPDVPFDRSINPYRGCEHGCIYCFARPSHAHLGLSPGLDFETRLVAKPDAAKLLRKELSKPGYRCAPIAMGSNTDPYQPIERRWQVTRQVLEVLLECNHPVSIVTKSALVERDLDLLVQLAQQDLVQVFVSVTTLDAELARTMEPRAASPRRRLKTLRTLAEAGVPCGVLAAPMIPGLNDAELDAILEAALRAGVRRADYILLRLPLEVRDLFGEWLETHYPLKAGAVMNRVRETRGGREYDPRFGQRMRGQGKYAALLQWRFELASRRLGLNRGRLALDSTRFVPPQEHSAQLRLF
jgi:DNA repair photolyase